MATGVAVLHLGVGQLPSIVAVGIDDAQGAVRISRLPSTVRTVSETIGEVGQRLGDAPLGEVPREQAPLALGPVEGPVVPRRGQIGHPGEVIEQKVSGCPWYPQDQACY